MHDFQKLTSFIALRANGWSLTSISLEINVPKSTLWDWDAKHRDQILRLKQHQLEKFQERFLPTYEEELACLRLYLNRIEAALQQTRFDDMSPAFLLQMALYLRTRLTRMREQPRSAREPDAQPPLTGRLTSHPYDQFAEDDLIPLPPAPESSVAPSPQQTANPENRTNPDETPGGVQSRSLIINHLQQDQENHRPVLHSQTAIPGVAPVCGFSGCMDQGPD